MKKILFAASAVVCISTASVSTGCNSSAKQAEVDSIAGRDSVVCADSTMNKVSVTSGNNTVDEMNKMIEEQAPNMLSEFYTRYVINMEEVNDNILKKFCTERLIQKLHDDYDYDGEGIAIWDFRSSKHDNEMYDGKLTGVESLGGGKFRVHYVNTGTAYSRDVAVVVVDGTVLLDEIND